MSDEPGVDAEDRADELPVGDEAAPEPPEPVGAEIAVERTPMGSKRGITESEERNYEPPADRSC